MCATHLYAHVRRKCLPVERVLLMLYVFLRGQRSAHISQKLVKFMTVAAVIADDMYDISVEYISNNILYICKYFEINISLVHIHQSKRLVDTLGGGFMPTHQVMIPRPQLAHISPSFLPAIILTSQAIRLLAQFWPPLPMAFQSPILPSPSLSFTP